MLKRLDIYLLDKGFFESREKARSNILAGNVIVNGNLVTKPGTFVNTEKKISIRIKDKFEVC